MQDLLLFGLLLGSLALLGLFFLLRLLYLHCMGEETGKMIVILLPKDPNDPFCGHRTAKKLEQTPLCREQTVYCLENKAAAGSFLDFMESNAVFIKKDRLLETLAKELEEEY